MLEDLSSFTRLSLVSIEGTTEGFIETSPGSSLGTSSLVLETFSGTAAVALTDVDLLASGLLSPGSPLFGDFSSFACRAATGSRGTIDFGTRFLRVGGSKSSDLSSSGRRRDFAIACPSWRSRLRAA